MGAALDQGSATSAAGGGSGHEQCSSSGSVRLGKPGLGTTDAGPAVETRTEAAVAARVKVAVWAKPGLGVSGCSDGGSGLGRSRWRRRLRETDDWGE